MNLNSGVLDDIESANPVLDNEIVEIPSGDTAQNGNSLVLQVNMDDKSNPSIIPEEELKVIPPIDTSFKLVEDGQAKVISLKDVEAEIIGQESISRSSVEYVNVAFEDVLNGPVKLNEFTVNPSKTNCSYVRQHMRRSIAKEEAAVVSNFQLLLDQPLSDAKEAYSRILVSYIPLISNQLYEMQGLVTSMGDTVIANKNSVFPTNNNGFVNIATTDFEDIDATNIPDAAAVGNITTLAMLTKKSTLRAFIHAVIEAKTYPEALSKEMVPVFMSYPTNARHLLKFYSGNAKDYINYLETTCEEQFKILNTLSSNCKDNMQTPEMTEQFISTSMPVMEQAFTVLTRAMHLIQQLSMLNYNAKGYLTYISKL